MHVCACLYVRPPSSAGGAASFCAYSSPLQRRLWPARVPAGSSSLCSSRLVEGSRVCMLCPWSLHSPCPVLFWKPWARLWRLLAALAHVASADAVGTLLLLAQHYFVLSTAGPLGACGAGEQDRRSTGLSPADCHQVGDTESPRNAPALEITFFFSLMVTSQEMLKTEARNKRSQSQELLSLSFSNTVVRKKTK